MALVTKEFKLDLAPGQLRPVVNASQGDIGRPFKADLYWNGSPWTATGYTAKIRGKKADNTVFEYTATVSGSSVTFSTTEQMTIISGPVECELAFENGTQKIATANFYLLVEGSAYNPDAPSTSDISGIGEDAIEDGAITTAKIADSAVTSAKLNDGAVSTAKLGSRAVTGAKIATNTIVWDNLASGLQNRIHMAEPNSWVVLENNYVKQVYDDIDDETYRLMASKLSTLSETALGSTDSVTVTRANGTIISVPYNMFVDSVRASKGYPSSARDISNAWYNGTLKDEVKTGNFSNVKVGDVIKGSSSGHSYVVVDFDYFKETGPSGQHMQTRHLVLMPAKSNDHASPNGAINSTASTAGGFKASTAFTTDLPAYADGILTDDFGDNLLTFPVYVSNAVTNGKASGAEWVNVKAMLPNEVQLAGYTSFGNPYDTGSGVFRFRLFDMFRKNWYFGNVSLRCCDIANNSQYSIWSWHGYFVPLNANQGATIKPYFCIGVTE